MRMPLLAALLLVAPAAGPALVPATAAQVVDAVRAAGARLVVVNVWATWCIPCREEMPHLVRLRREWAERGVALILVSGDFASASTQASEFLAEQGVDFGSFLKAQKDQAFIDGLDPAWSGALPATFFFDAAGRRLRSVYEPLTYEALEAEVRSLLVPSPAPDRAPRAPGAS